MSRSLGLNYRDNPDHVTADLANSTANSQLLVKYTGGRSPPDPQTPAEGKQIQRSLYGPVSTWQLALTDVN
jgi:hypothetical protein